MKGKTASDVSVITNTDASNIIKATISSDKQAKLFDLLQNPYSDPISSIVREITSNCIDSHVEAQKQDKAVVIELATDEAGLYIAFEDFGIGMNEQFIRNRYSMYLDSTKEDTNTQIGYFGIGSKSPLSYTPSFFMTTRRDGIELQYTVRKDDDGIPVVQKLIELPTTEDNGTRIWFYIHDTDQNQFRKAIKTQLRYFNNVYVEDKWPAYCNDSDKYSNDYKIYEGKFLKIRDDEPGDSILRLDSHNSSGLHLVIQNVYYPIDWNQITFKDEIEKAGGIGLYAHIKSITDVVNNLDVAVKFNIGEVNVTMTRESIKYTKQTRAIIQQRIIQCLEELMDLSVEGAKLKNYIDYYRTNINQYRLKLNDEKYAELWFSKQKYLFVKKIGIEKTFISPYYIGLNNLLQRWPQLQAERNLFGAYNLRVVEEGNHIRLETTDVKAALINQMEDGKRKQVFRMSDTLSRRKNEYIFDTLNCSTFYGFVPKKKSLKLFKAILRLEEIPKQQWRQCIVDYITETEKFLIEHTLRYEDVKIPYSWYIQNKPTDDDVTLENPLGIDKTTLFMSIKTVYDGRMDKKKHSLQFMENVFTKRHNRRLPDWTVIMLPAKWATYQFYRIKQFLSTDHIQVIVVSKTNMEILNQLDGYYDMDKLAKQSNTYLGKIATNIIIQQMFRKSMRDSALNNINDSKVATYISRLSDLVPEWKPRISNVNKILDNYKPQGYHKYIQDLLGDNVSKDVQQLWVAIVNSAITQRTLDYDAIIDAEFLCRTYARYGKLIQENANVTIHNLVALDISYSRKRIIPFIYYRSFRKQVNKENRNPSTCNGLGLAASLIHQYYNRTNKSGTQN